jgi:hypothetical protein
MLFVLVLIATLSVVVFLYAFIVTTTNDNDDDNNDDDIAAAAAAAASSIIVRRRYLQRRRAQTPMFTYNTSLFPNASGPFNRSFGIGGQQQPSRPNYPLSSLGGIFSMASGGGGIGGDDSNTTTTVSAFDVSFFAAPGKLFEGDFGIDFPIPFNVPVTTTTTTTTTSTAPPPSTTTTTTTSTTTSTAPPPSTTTTTTTTATTTTTTAMVPASLFFFAQDRYNNLPNNRSLDTHPNSLTKRNAFLTYFNQQTSSPQQSFENVSFGVLTSPAPIPLSTIGNVTFSGNIQIVIDAAFFAATHGIKSVGVQSSIVEIVFPVNVVGVGFTIFDLTNVVQLQFKLNNDNVEMITLPLNISISGAGVIFIGYINYNGFNTMLISPTPGSDTYYLDQFTAYQASELMLLPP